MVTQAGWLRHLNGAGPEKGDKRWHLVSPEYRDAW